MDVSSVAITASGAERRRHERVVRPLDGWRGGVIETPVHIYDLSEGGCFITSLHEQEPGVAMLLKIHLPPGVWISVHAETLRGRSDAGFAVRFIDMSDETRACLMRALDLLQTEDGAEAYV